MTTTPITTAPVTPVVMVDPGDNVGGQVAIAREDIELKAAIIMARSLPRDESAAHLALMKACKRPKFADDALYSYPRSGQVIEGPSVKLAREAMRVWGNMRSGIRIVSKDDDWIHVAGWAHDLEANIYRAAEDKFRRIIFRRNKGNITPDERDERELTFRRGSILERNAILIIIPPDLIEDAMRTANETLEANARQQLKDSPEKILKELVAAFDGIGVTPAMIAEKVGHPLEILTAVEIVKLRGIFKGIVNKETTREDNFKIPGAPAAREAATLESLMGGEKKPA